MKHVLMAVLVLSGTAAFAGTKTWKGASGGSWTDPANWDPEGVPTAADDVEFAPEGDMEVAIGTGNAKSLSFLRGNTKFTASNVNISIPEQEETFLHIAEGATFTLQGANSITAQTGSQMILKKTGLGTFYMNGCVGNSTNPFKQLDIHAGLVIPGSVNALRSHTRIRAGAELRFGCNGCVTSGAYSPTIWNSKVITVDAGGTFDQHGYSATLEAIVGTGSVVNRNDDGTVANAANLTLQMKFGPYAFDGTLEGGGFVGSTYKGPVVVLAPETPNDPNQRWILNRGDALAHGSVIIGSSSSAATTVVDPLGFAAGVGRFDFASFDFGKVGSTQKLEDEAGEGVTVVANTTTSGNGRFGVTGKGNFYLTTASGIGDRTFIGNAFAGLTGEAGVISGVMILGDGTAAHDVDLSTVSGLVADATNVSQYVYTCINWNNTTPAKFEKPVRGNGRFMIKQPIEFTQLQIGPDLTKFELRAPVTVSGKGSKAVVGPYVYMTSVPNSSLTVTDGAELTGRPYDGTRYDNAYTVLPVNQGDGFSVEVAGTSLTIRDGGSIGIVGVVPDTVNLLAGGTINLFNQMNVSGQVSEAAPAVVNLDGGLLRVRPVKFTSISINQNTAKQKVVIGARGVFVDIDAETGFESAMATFCQRPIFGTAGGDGGMTRTGGGYLRFEGAGEFAGDMRNLDGILQLGNTDMVATEASHIFGYGNLLLANCRFEAVANLPFQVTTFAGASGKHFAYDGAVTLRLRTGADKPAQSLVIGPADASANSALVRAGKGAALFVQDFVADAALDGSALTVKVNGGVENAASGATKQPIFAYTARSAHGFRQVDFMSYDAERGLLRFDGAVEGLGGGADTIAKVTVEKVTLESGETQAAGLNVHAIDGLDSTAGTLAEIGNDRAPLVIADGATLKLGNGTDPACILLNNNQAGNNQYPAGIKGAGTIDFGTSEGVITVGRVNAADRAAYVVPRITGTGGLTLVSASDSATERLFLGGANAYTGGTRISNLRVEIRNTDCFGTGDVYVNGGDMFGGQLYFAQSTSHPGMAVLTNRLHVSGKGVSSENGSNVGQEWGSIWFARPTRLTGDVEIVGETRVTAGNGPTVEGTGSGSYGRFEGVVSGGRLQVWKGVAEVVLTRPNTYTGGTEVVQGTLTLEGAGTAGTGEIVLDGGTLRLKNTVPLTIAKLSGKGTVSYEGSATVTIVDRTEFAGTYAGDLTGDVDFVKDGSQTLYCAGKMVHTGKTEINAGKVVLNEPVPSPTLPVTDAALHLDASDATSVTVDENGKVLAWADVDGRDLIFEPDMSSGYNLTTYEEGAVGDLAAIKSTGRFRLAVTNTVSPRTAFLVIRADATCDTAAYLFGPLAGSTGGAFTFKDAPAAGWCSLNNFGITFMNGEEGRDFELGSMIVHTRFAPNVMRDFTKATLGDFPGWGHAYKGLLCEVITYERVLDDTERLEVESYLMGKWGVRTTGTAKRADVLPTTAVPTIAADATLDLAGSDQTLAGFDCAGSLVNTYAMKSTLTLTGDAAFEAGAAFGGKIDLVLKAGVTLDLGGGTFTIRRLVNEGGQVVNGTLNETNPKGGLLLLVR